MPVDPTFPQLIRAAIAGKLLDVHTAIPGRVEKYDGSKQVADVVPVVRGVIETVDGEPVLEDIPVIQNVPVCWPRGGGYSLQFPLNQGDHGLLVFSEAAIAQWRATGEISEPGDLRRHDLSYPIFFPGIAPDSGALPSCGSAAVLDGPTLIRLGGIGAQAVALAPLVAAALQTLKGAFDSWTPVAQDGGAALKTILSQQLSAWPPNLAATKVKAE